MHKYERLGVMLDMSRNGVMTVARVKNYIDLLQKMGYNCLELYCEDTFEVEGEPYFGYLRGGYSIADIQELDAYAKERGIELIPCIQTLAHFTCMAKVPHYWDLFDIDDILMIGDEKVYALLDKMFASLAKAFSSRHINIGMDEAHNVGLGKYLNEHGYCNRSEILVQHLNKVNEIAKKYGFKCHMWSDMFFRLVSGGSYEPKDFENVRISPEIAAKVPKDVAITYWTYARTDKKDYDIMFQRHKEFGRDVWFAGGAMTWEGFAPLNWYSLQSTKAAFESVREFGIENVIITVWGDNGKQCSYFSVLPTLYAARQFADGNFDMDKIKAGFKQLFGLDFDTFMHLDCITQLKKDGAPTGSWNCLSATMFYNDCFLGWRDLEYAALDPMPFGRFAEMLERDAQSMGDYAILFETMSKLCLYLEYKAPIGLKTREAYRSGDKAAVRALVEYYRETVRRLDAFTGAFRKQWLWENRAFGWEIQEIRMGGTRARILACADRLQQYADGVIDTIEELDADILPFQDRNGFMYHMYTRAISPCNI